MCLRAYIHHTIEGLKIQMPSPSRSEQNKRLDEIFNIVDNTGYWSDCLYVGIGGDPKGHVPRWLSGKKGYKTLDIAPASGADIIADICHTSLPENSFDLILLTSLLEHVFNVQTAIDECYRILRLNGWLVIATPWDYPYHGEQGTEDYWRMSKFALKELLKQFREVNVSQLHYNSYAWARK